MYIICIYQRLLGCTQQGEMRYKDNFGNTVRQHVGATTTQVDLFVDQQQQQQTDTHTHTERERK